MTHSSGMLGPRLISLKSLQSLGFVFVVLSLGREKMDLSFLQRLNSMSNF